MGLGTYLADLCGRDHGEGISTDAHDGVHEVDHDAIVAVVQEASRISVYDGAYVRALLTTGPQDHRTIGP